MGDDSNSRLLPINEDSSAQQGPPETSHRESTDDRLERLSRQMDNLVSAVAKLMEVREQQPSGQASDRSIHQEGRGGIPTEIVGQEGPTPVGEPRGSENTTQVFQSHQGVEGDVSGPRTVTSESSRLSHERTFSQVVNLTPIDTEPFSGDRNLALAWIEDYENAMEASGCPDSLKLRRIRAYLTGIARDWLELVKSRCPNLDWPSFKKRFIEDFCGIDVVQQAKRQLGIATQESGEHPYTFAVRVLGLCRKANPQMSEEEKIMHCLQGLNESLRNTLACLRPRKDWDLDDLLQLLAAQTGGAGAETSQWPLNHPKPPREMQTTPKVTRTEDRNAWTCFNCGSKDHFAKDCKALAKEKKPVEANAARDDPPRAANALNLQVPEPSRKKPHLPCDDTPKPMLIIELNHKEVLGRADTGADMTVIPDDVAEELGIQLLPWDQPPLRDPGGATVPILGMAAVLASHGGSRRPLLVAVASSKSLKQTLWGVDTLHAFGKIDFSQYSGDVPVNGQEPDWPTHSEGDPAGATEPPPVIDKIEQKHLDIESPSNSGSTPIVRHKRMASKDGRTTTSKVIECKEVGRRRHRSFERLKKQNLDPAPKLPHRRMQDIDKLEGELGLKRRRCNEYIEYLKRAPVRARGRHQHQREPD